jgi:hypothetical protein
MCVIVQGDNGLEIPVLPAFVAQNGRFRILTLRQPSGPPYQVGQARLSAMGPSVATRIAMADHNAGPSFAQGLKGRLATAGLRGKHGHGGIDHDPDVAASDKIGDGSISRCRDFQLVLAFLFSRFRIASEELTALC